MNNNKLIWVIITLLLAILLVGVGGRILIDKITDRVIQKMEKNYSPSPYGPGIDPDKFDLEKIKSQ